MPGSKLQKILRFEYLVSKSFFSFLGASFNLGEEGFVSKLQTLMEISTKKKVTILGSWQSRYLDASQISTGLSLSTELGTDIFVWKSFFSFLVAVFQVREHKIRFVGLFTADISTNIKVTIRNGCL